MKKFFLWNLFSVFFFIFSGCGDFVEETDTNACERAIDERDYDTAISNCSSRKDKATAYMGKAGYDVVNLLKSSSTAPSSYSAPSGVELGTDDISGASILNILQLSTDTISDYTKRATSIINSKIYLDNTSALLHPYLNDNSSPLSADEILLDTFALAFSMQLYQVITYDNATTASAIYPSGDPGSLSCNEVNGADGTEAKAMLKAMDGHLWTSERNAIQCSRMKTAIESLSSDNQTAVLLELANNWTPGEDLLPAAIRNAICNPIDDLTTYLSKLTESVSKLTLSGDNTKSITDAQTSTNTLLKQVGCKE